VSPPAARTSRAPRGRLLIVGDDALAPRVDERLHQAPARADSLFDALGQIRSSEAARPVVAIIVAENRWPADRRVSDAIHRVDPAVRVIRVTPAGAIREDGEDMVDAPLDAESLSRLLGSHWLMPRGDDACITESAPPPPLARETAPPAPPPPLVATPALPPRTSPPPPPVDADVTDDLGDTDLIEAMMSDPAGVTERALSLIRQQTGWTDLVLLPPEAEPPDDVATAEVCGSRPFGTLLSGEAAGRPLEPWASWLARWLTLDAAHRAYREMAYRDDLTGTWNRRYLSQYLRDRIAEARPLRRQVTVMVFDIDNFKRYNDEFGHDAGDVILCETVGLLNSVIRGADRVCRIGGDEFAVIFADLDAPRESGSSHPATPEKIAVRFQEQVCRMRFPKLGLEAPGTLSISAGLASFPWDGHDPAGLLRLADQRALESKRKGKNHITFGPGVTVNTATRPESADDASTE